MPHGKLKSPAVEHRQRLLLTSTERVQLAQVMAGRLAFRENGAAVTAGYLQLRLEKPPLIFRALFALSVCQEDSHRAHAIALTNSSRHFDGAIRLRFPFGKVTGFE